MKSLIEIANELKVTPQAIYKKKSSDAALAAAITKGSVKVGRTVKLTDEAEAAIMQAFRPATKSNKDYSNSDNLRYICELLREQLKQKDNQIAALSQMLSTRLLLLEPPKKQGFFSRFRRKQQPG